MKEEAALISIVASCIPPVLRGTQGGPRQIFRVGSLSCRIQIFSPWNSTAYLPTQPPTIVITASWKSRCSQPYLPPSSTKTTLPLLLPQYKAAPRNGSSICHLLSGVGFTSLAFDSGSTWHFQVLPFSFHWHFPNQVMEAAAVGS